MQYFTRAFIPFFLFMMDFVLNGLEVEPQPKKKKMKNYDERPGFFCVTRRLEMKSAGHVEGGE